MVSNVGVVSVESELRNYRRIFLGSTEARDALQNLCFTGERPRAQIVDHAGGAWTSRNRRSGSTSMCPIAAFALGAGADGLGAFSKGLSWPFSKAFYAASSLQPISRTLRDYALVCSQYLHDLAS